MQVGKRDALFNNLSNYICSGKRNMRVVIEDWSKYLLL